jgi:uncharacterized repeat protein (TIGR03803 family)
MTNAISKGSPGTSGYAVLHSFGSTDDGAVPWAGLIAVDGTLYGTTYYGGVYNYNGTVFSINASGTEQVLHSFGSGSDGGAPRASLIAVKGKLYGTTAGGGTYGRGTVVSITTKGVERVLHSFTGADGADPQASLLDVAGTLYGTTYDGGAYGGGTVFSITTTGKERVLHSFGHGRDGAYPLASLIEANGTLYGTTFYGGASRHGTVFSLSTDGEESVLHSFGSTYTDGSLPASNLIDVDGTFYGTTVDGGGLHACLNFGCGTVYSISSTGSERVVYSFSKAGSSGVPPDGGSPQAGLIAVHGTLYGTTARGGPHNGGVIFSLSKSGELQVLHGFGQSGDGAYCWASLIDVNGTLYGTTTSGGTYNSGVAFALTL